MKRTTPEKALPLKGLAALVDREAWGVAMAAKNGSVPYRSYKLVSDMAGTLKACELVKEQAAEWSQELAQFLSKILGQSADAEPHALNLPGFYFTFSSAHLFENLLQKLSLKDNITREALLDSLPLEDLRAQKLMPKERSKRIIEIMEQRLDPVKSQVQTQIEAWKKPYTEMGLNLGTDPSWEDPSIKISFSINSESELTQKIEQLKELQITPYQKVLNGSLDVE